MAAVFQIIPSSLISSGTKSRVPVRDRQAPSLFETSCSVVSSQSFVSKKPRTSQIVQSTKAHLISPGSSSLLSETCLERRNLQNQKRRRHFVVVAGVVANDGVRWWEKDGLPNMKDLHSTQEFVEALAEAKDHLVVIEFYATWCGSCRALFPKLCKIAEQYQEILFYKVNFDENKAMCKSLNIKVLPYFHFYRGAEGRLDAFSASISKLQRLKDALALHSPDRCSLGPPPAVEGLDLELLLDSSASTSSSDVSTPAGGP